MGTSDALTARLRKAGCVFAEEEAALLREAATGVELEALVVRREAGEPLEVILGWAEFDGLRIRLVPGVFVPRRRSLILVDQAVARAPRRVIDLSCGSGALGAAVRRRLPEVELWGTDVDPVAVDCARLNLPPDRVVVGDLFDALPDGLRVDVILAHLPYVPTRSIAFMPAEARLHEPRAALDGGDDGLDLQRRAIAAAPAWLAPGGALVVASSDAQAPISAELMRAAGLEPRIVRDEELDATAVIGAAPPRVAG